MSQVGALWICGYCGLKNRVGTRCPKCNERPPGGEELPQEVPEFRDPDVETTAHYFERDMLERLAAFLENNTPIYPGSELANEVVEWVSRAKKARP
jgi:methionyl-tRNA synthetase